MTELPPPPVPADVDLRGFPFMPLDVEALRRSKAWLLCKRNPALAFYMINLWTAAWHEVPAGSLEDDDDVLADRAMCDPVKWDKLRDQVLRNWVKCSDGRLYYPFLSKKVLAAWDSRLEQRWKTEIARIKKHNDRHRTSLPRPTFDEWVSSGCPSGHRLPVPGDKPGTGDGQGGEMPSKGEGEGEGEDIKPKPPEAALIDDNTIGGADDAAERDRKDEPADPPSTGTRRGHVSALLRQWGVTITPGNPHLVAWVQAGITDEQLREAVDRVRLQKPEPESIPPNYLAKVVADVLNPAPVAALTVADPVVVARWWESDAATTEQANRLGMASRLGENWPEFRQRIRDALEARKATKTPEHA